MLLFNSKTYLDRKTKPCKHSYRQKQKCMTRYNLRDKFQTRMQQHNNYTPCLTQDSAKIKVSKYKRRYQNWFRLVYEAIVKLFNSKRDNDHVKI